MSAETKKTVETIKKNFETVKQGSQEMGREASKLGDKELLKKIEKVHESASEVVKHIEHKTNTQNN